MISHFQSHSLWKIGIVVSFQLCSGCVCVCVCGGGDLVKYLVIFSIT